MYVMFLFVLCVMYHTYDCVYNSIFTNITVFIHWISLVFDDLIFEIDFTALNAIQKISRLNTRRCFLSNVKLSESRILIWSLDVIYY